MKSRKGITLIEIIGLVFVCFVLIVIVGGGCLMVKGCNYVVDTVETTVDDKATAHAERLVSNPPLYKVGDIVYHKASDQKLLVAKKSTSWNEVKEGWDMKVKDGGNMDKIGGFIINENEVKASLE